MWKHADAKASSLGCFGFALILAAGVLGIPTLIKGDSISINTWILAIAGIVVLGLFMGFISRSQRRIARYQKRRNDRANKIRDEVLTHKNPSTPYFIYLRPFAIDDKFIYPPSVPADARYVEEYGLPKTYHDLESALALLVYSFGELVALSKKEGRAGAGHVKSTNGSWENDVLQLCQHAEGIFVVPFSFEGTAWEIEMILKEGFKEKTFFIMPAKSVLHRYFGLRLLSRDYGKLWEEGRSRYHKLGLELPEYNNHGGIVLIEDEIKLLSVFDRKFHDNDAIKRSKQDFDILKLRLEQLAASNRSD